MQYNVLNYCIPSVLSANIWDRLRGDFGHPDTSPPLLCEVYVAKNWIPFVTGGMNVCVCDELIERGRP